MRRGISGILLVFLKVMLILWTPSLPASETGANANPLSAQLQSQSRQLALARHRMWQLLLHHAPGSGVSEIDDSEFFLAENGRSDAQAELDATLEAFFGALPKPVTEDSPHCRYPARYQWLSQQLDIEADPEVFDGCAGVKQWRQSFDADSVSLIFSDYYLNSPPSMFGHTLLRFNSHSRPDDDLLDYTVNYSAKVDTDSMIGYAWHGTTGGFEGRFSASPYYIMVKEYNDMQHRDLWEYELNLTRDQIYFIWLHLWELSDTYFDYYFFQENCSYHLLSLLEVGRPELKLRERFPLWTMPAETVRGLDDYPGLVVSVHRRPSVASELDAALKTLDADERQRLRQLLEEPGGQALEGISPQRQARLLDTGSTLLQYRLVDAGDSDSSIRRQRHQLLSMRSRLPPTEVSVSDRTAPDAVAPGRGHPPASVSLAAISVDSDVGDDDRDGTRFELSLQPGYHDLLARSGGHAPNSQINFLNLRLLQNPQRDAWEVEQFELVDMRSLVASSEFIKAAAWKFRVGWYRNRDGACSDCRPFVINPGVGIAGSSSIFGNETAYVLLEGLFEFDHELADDKRYGLATTFGLILNHSNRWRSRLEVDRSGYGGSHRDYLTQGRWLNRVGWIGEIDLMLDLERIGDDTLARIGLNSYW